MPQIRISAPDLRRHLNNLNRFTLTIPDDIGNASRQQARDILHDSDNKPPKVPVKDGHLQSTGRIAEISVSGARRAWAVLYGGRSALGNKVVDYAELVHDDVTTPKRWTRPGSGPKFVSTHIERREHTMGLAFLEAMDKAAARTIGK